MNNIQGKVVLITGGANGLGYKYAEDFLQHGAKGVALLDLATSGGEKSADTLEKQFGKGRVVFYPCDVSNTEQFAEAFKKTIDNFGGIDIAINNAGVPDHIIWEKTVDVNLNGVIRGTLLAMDHMSKHKGGKGGTIVNIASIAGLTPFGGAPVYSATKEAVIGFSRSIQECYDTTGVRILTMCPGITITRMSSGIDNRVFDFVNVPKTRKKFEEHPTQTVDVVSKAVVEMIEEGKNGDIWVSEAGKPPYAVDIPHYSNWAVPTPEHVANAIIELIEKGENGAILVSENNQPPYAIETPDYTTGKVTA